MKQNENEWLEYQNVMEDVVKRSGLDKSIFYDLRGNHDNFGVPAVGGSFDFFSKYSINGQLGRKGNVNSVTVEVSCSFFLFFILLWKGQLFPLKYIFKQPQSCFLLGSQDSKP